MPTTPTTPVLGSQAICGVDENGQPVRITVNTHVEPPAMWVDIPDKPLRDLGVVTVDGIVNQNTLTIRVSYSSAQTDEPILTQAPGGSIVVTAVQVAGSNSLDSSPSVVIGFGAATTPTAAGVVFSHPGIISGGFYAFGGGAGAIGIGADGEDLRITTGTITTGTVDVVVSYYIQ